MPETKLSANEREAANRGEVTALLIRAGYRVYRPEADVNGEDLLLRTPAGDFRPVQLKGRPLVDQRRYGRRGIWMLFPAPNGLLGRPWYLIEHDVFYLWVYKRHGHASGWDDAWGYSGISQDLRAFLEPYRIAAVVSDEIGD